MSVLKGEKEDYPEESFEVFKANYDPNEPEKIINLFSAATDDNGKFCKNVFDFGKMLKDNGTDTNTACMFMNASKEGEYIVKERYKAAKELLEMGVENDLIQRLINICCQNSLNSFYYSTHFNHNLMAAKKLFKTENLMKRNINLSIIFLMRPSKKETLLKRQMKICQMMLSNSIFLLILMSL